MFSLRRNQVIIAALVLMICVAGYLNYLDTRVGGDAGDIYSMTGGGEIGAIVLDGFPGQEVAVMNGETFIGTAFPSEAAPEDTSVETEPGTAVFVSASSDSSFFVQTKLGREQDRSRQKETLTNLIGSGEIDQDTKTLCAEAILEITRRMESESAAEAALVAKGFGESYVRIDDNWVEVIINKSVITDQELAQLEDIVTRLTGASVSQIRLSSVKN
ncbi:MAG: SpoIIIAH-like family protein [Defluviitaleaceae bacterium]|nr:SpoIIIAH-like family protein [Defluviitaleaceae bacterium]